jgi:phosphomannomutase/phosphoglucomutase
MSHVFRQYDIRGVAGRDLTEESVADLGKSLATFYWRNNVNTISLGYDCRLSSPGFRKALLENLLNSGINVYDLGMGPTPLVYFSLFNLPVGGGVMITGSHNPPNENGFKICLDKTTIFSEQIQEIKEIMEAKDYQKGQEKLIEHPIIPEYLKYLKSIIKPGSKRLKVVVDAGNGAGNLTAIDYTKASAGK